jgi:acyl carrier protein
LARPYESALDGSLRELIVKHARVKPALVRDEDRIAGDLGYDSFALVNLLLDLEDAYGFEVDASELAAFREMTYGQFRRLVGERLARTPSRGEEAVP